MALINAVYTPEFLADRLQEVLDAAGDVSGLLDAMTRCYGRDLAEQAYNVLCSRLPGLQPKSQEPAPYKLFDNGMIGEYRGGMYRFYCYPSSWHISPAARSGAVYEV